MSMQSTAFAPVGPMPFHAILGGEEAFYNSPDYVANTQRDFAHEGPLPASYRVTTEAKIFRVVKQVLAIVLFPVGIYQWLHSLVGRIALLPASCPNAHKRRQIMRIHHNPPLDSNWAIKRFTLEVDGCTIDAAIVGQRSTLNNGRWTLVSTGNGEFYEEYLSGVRGFQDVLTGIQGNALLFNYPSVPDGWPDRQTIIKAYRAMLAFLEDQNGLAAHEIIGLGHSLGGGVQGEALEGYQLKEGVKHVFVKSRTFSCIHEEASYIGGKFLGFLARFFGWNIGSVESSSHLRAPEIILQTASVDGYEVLHDSARIISDGVIGARASLATALLDDPSCPKDNKVFIGIPEWHNDGFSDPGMLSMTINRLLQEQ